MSLKFLEIKKCAELPEALSLTGTCGDIDLMNVQKYLLDRGIKSMCLGRRPTLLVRSHHGMLMIEESGIFSFTRIKNIEDAKLFLNELCNNTKTGEKKYG